MRCWPEHAASILSNRVSFFFFFQAEDGIRDSSVTGVQTCALPISKSIVFKEGTPDSQADRALAKLTQLAQYFDDESTPYRSLVHPMWRTHYGDYDHLARVKEWSSSGGVTDDFIGGE